METCESCGAKLRAGDEFCHVCGTPVPADVKARLADSSPSNTGRIALIVLAAVLAVLVLGGLGVLVGHATFNGPGTATTGASSSAITTSVAGGSSSAPATTQPVVAPPVAPAPSKTSTPTPAKPSANANDVTHEATFIVKNSVADGGATQLTCDYVQFLTGSAATKAAAAHGDTVENDYYVANDNPKLRTFPVSSSVTIVLHPGSGPSFSRNFTTAEFKSLMSTHEATYGGQIFGWSKDQTYWINVKSGKITRIENQWVP